MAHKVNEDRPKLKLPGRLDPRLRWFAWYALLMLIVLLGWQDLVRQLRVRSIPYSQVKAHLARAEVVVAEVKQDEIVGRIVPLAAQATNRTEVVPELKAPETNLAEVPIGVRRALAETEPFYFRTVRVDDPDLVMELQAAGEGFAQHWQKPCTAGC